MKFRLLAFMLLIALTSFADNAKILVKQKSGNETILELATKPVITFSGEDMVITNDFTTISIPLADIDSYVVNAGTEGIEQPIIEKNLTEGRITFNNLPAGTTVHVYTMDGRQFKTLAAGKASNAEVNLHSLPKGTYIISASNKRVKVINK